MLAISHFMTASTSEDFFHEMIVCCYNAKEKYCGNTFFKHVHSLISEVIKKQNNETQYLYNSHKNISINQCISDSKTPVSDWLNLSDWSEWE